MIPQHHTSNINKNGGFHALLNAKQACRIKGGECVTLDNCDLTLNVYKDHCGYDHICCISRRTICSKLHGFCTSSESSCLNAGTLLGYTSMVVFSWLNCNNTERCCHPVLLPKGLKHQENLGSYGSDLRGHGLGSSIDRGKLGYSSHGSDHDSGISRYDDHRYENGGTHANDKRSRYNNHRGGSDGKLKRVYSHRKSRQYGKESGRYDKDHKRPGYHTYKDNYEYEHDRYRDERPDRYGTSAWGAGRKEDMHINRDQDETTNYDNKGRDQIYAVVSHHEGGYHQQYERKEDNAYHQEKVDSIDGNDDKHNEFNEDYEDAYSDDNEYYIDNDRYDTGKYYDNQKHNDNRDYEENGSTEHRYGTTRHNGRSDYFQDSVLGDKVSTWNDEYRTQEENGQTHQEELDTFHALNPRMPLHNGMVYGPRSEYANERRDVYGTSNEDGSTEIGQRVYNGGSGNRISYRDIMQKITRGGDTHFENHTSHGRKKSSLLIDQLFPGK